MAGNGSPAASRTVIQFCRGWPGDTACSFDSMKPISRRIDGRPVENAWTTTSPDGQLTFTLRWCSDGVYAVRVQLNPAGGKVVQCVLFSDEAGFLRWCDADSAKFNYPLVCSNVRRRGCEFFARAAQDAQVGLQRP